MNFQDLVHALINSRLGLIVGGLILLLVVLWLFRFAKKILFIVILLIVVVLLAHEAVDRAESKAGRAYHNAVANASNAMPDWLKKLWNKMEPYVPSSAKAIEAAKDKATDKACGAAGLGTACNILKRIKQSQDQISADEKSIDAICRASPAVEQQFPDATHTIFCAGNPAKRAQQIITSIGGAVGQDTIDSIPLSNFFVPEPAKLETNEYLNCLYAKTKARPDVNARSCTQKDPHQWRLCTEFHLQLPHESVGGNAATAPLDPDILACRAQALKK
jgi:hypothetical protein